MDSKARLLVAFIVVILVMPIAFTVNPPASFGEALWRIFQSYACAVLGGVISSAFFGDPE